MPSLNAATALLLAVTLTMSAAAQSSSSQLALGSKAIESRTGCYLVDYSFVETDALKPGYVRDNRVYDVNRDKSVKEWIYADQISPTRICLQHVLFAADLTGKLKEDSILKHTGEDWEYDAPYLYDYAGSSTWTVKSVKATPGLWTRRVTSLDDGLRYQCAAQWNATNAYPEWSCSGLAPIPGRETRDMHRKDYTLLDRTTRIIVYDNNWLERESNTKIIDENSTRTPLVKEQGKIWYVRLPDVECIAAQEFVTPRKAFWKIVRETWDQVLNGDSTFKDATTVKDQPSRYEQILELEEKFLKQNLAEPVIAKQAHEAILEVIQISRAH